MKSRPDLLDARSPEGIEVFQLTGEDDFGGASGFSWGLFIGHAKNLPSQSRLSQGFDDDRDDDRDKDKDRQGYGR